MSGPPSTTPTAEPPNSTPPAPVISTGGLPFSSTSPTTNPVGLVGGSVGAPTAPGAQSTGSPTLASTGPISPDIASVSTWQLGQIQSDQIDLGGGLSAPNGGVMTIGQAMTWFQQLPQAELMQIQAQLWAGGYYTDANGNPLQTAPALGSHDNQSFRAFLEAIIQAYDTGQSVTDVVNNSIQTGVGANNRATLPSSVTGGGNEYNVDLTNPADVELAANQMFQAALGRNATPAEIGKITSSLQGQETSQGLAQESGSELSSRERYQTSLNQRNLQYQFQTTPKVAMGAVPNGPIVNPEQWAVSFLQYAFPNKVTASNVAFLTGWISANGTKLNGFNPLAAQNQVPGSNPPGKQGGAPSYASWAQGLQATTEALLSGNYGNITAALMSGDATSWTNNKQVQSEMNKWSGGSYSTVKAGNGQAASQAIAGLTSQQTNAVPQAGQDMVGKRLAGDQFQAPMPTPTQTTSSVGPASASSVPAADVNPGQTVSNPGDQYIGPVTTYTTNPASADAASYQAATTGPNRIQFGANNFLNAYNATLAMIKAGGPTSG